MINKKKRGAYAGFFVGVADFVSDIRAYGVKDRKIILTDQPFTAPLVTPSTMYF